VDQEIKRVVIKLGTGLLSAGKGEIRAERISQICSGIDALKKGGVEVIIVSSGAVGLGMGKLGLEQRPSELSLLRSCASIGQSELMHAWKSSLGNHGLLAAQILLTREDFNQHGRSQKVKETIETLLQHGVVPVVNENDSISDEELKFGDNDVLSALLASLSHSELLIILTTAKGLMTSANSGILIPFVSEITPEIEKMAEGTKSATAVGGMATKIEAAKVATKSGCAVFIGSGENPGRLPKVIQGDAEGTFFAPAGLSLNQRKKWLAFFPSPKGSLEIDHGACEAILKNGASLLASGVIRASGTFGRAEVVSILNPEGKIIARGICRFSNHELNQIIGQNNDSVLSLHPWSHRPEVVHRDFLAPLIQKESSEED
jgi:glutamate 5-kinase